MSDLEGDAIDTDPIIGTLISGLQSPDIDKRIRAFYSLRSFSTTTARLIIQKADGIYPGLEEFGRDVMQCAEDGDFDLVQVEDKVIERALMIMKRRRKNCPLILDDDPDFRKSIVEVIVRRITSGEASENLKIRRILMLDMDKLLEIPDGGELEKQLRAVFMDMVCDDSTIVYIDGIDRILTRCTENTHTAIEKMLICVRVWGEQIIGGTTGIMYRTCIQNNAMLDRCFALVVPSLVTSELVYRSK